MKIVELVTNGADLYLVTVVFEIQVSIIFEIVPRDCNDRIPRTSFENLGAFASQLFEMYRQYGLKLRLQPLNWF